MAIEVVIYDRSPMEVTEIARDLKHQGYKINVDFDYAYHPPKWDHFGHEEPTRRYTIFTFYNEKHATFFSIKYS